MRYWVNHRTLYQKALRPHDRLALQNDLQPDAALYPLPYSCIRCLDQLGAF